MSIRRLGALVECLHDVVYFAPEPQQAYAELGLRGYWRGYFASRAAALGTPSAEQVTSLFAGFAPEMVSRAVPEVWRLADRDAVLFARLSGTVAALRRLGVVETDPRVSDAADLVAHTVDQLDLDGCPMAAALAALPESRDVVARLWQGCSVLRELRGDAHFAVLAGYDLPWPQPHLLLAATGRLDPRQREFRGWNEDVWAAAAEDLKARGLYDTEAGAALIEEIAVGTDRAFAAAAREADLSSLEASLEPLAIMVAPELPFPNAIGLPPLTDR